jgi:hypothetical protein
MILYWLTGNEKNWQSFGQNGTKKFGMNFDRVFKNKKLSILEKCFNKVCVKFYRVSDSKKIILYFRKYIDFLLVKSQFFDF